MKGLVLIVTDAGGPIALHNLLSDMPRDFPLPIVVLQSAEVGLTESFAAALRRTVSLKVEILGEKTSLRSGGVFLGSPGTTYRPKLSPSRVLIEAISAGELDICLRQTVENFTHLYGRKLTVIFLSGRGGNAEISRCCALLEASGCNLMVLNRFEAVVSDLGRQVLDNSMKAEELSTTEIVARLTAFVQQAANEGTRRVGSL